MSAAIGDGVKISLNIEQGKLMPLDFYQYPLTGGELAGCSYLDSLTHILTVPHCSFILKNCQ